jgi:hypothetical protein
MSYAAKERQCAWQLNVVMKLLAQLYKDPSVRAQGFVCKTI